MKNNIKITCKKHNYLFEVKASNHFSNAKKEIKENIVLTGGCNKCISCIRKANIYKNNDTHFKYIKVIYPKYYKLNINFKDIDNEIKLL
jgi:hypothetical protein